MVFCPVITASLPLTEGAFKEKRFSGRSGKVPASFPSGPLRCVQVCPRSRARKSECKNSKAESPKKLPLVLAISWAKSHTWHGNKGPVCEQQGAAPPAAFGRQRAGLAPPVTGLSSAVGSVSEARQPLLTLSLGLTGRNRRVRWKQMSI